MVSDVGNIDGKIIRNGSLYTQRPGANVRQPHIRINRLCVAGSWVCRYQNAIAALQCKNGGGEDTAAGRAPSTYTGSGLVLPVIGEGVRLCSRAARYAFRDYAHIAHAGCRDAVYDERGSGGNLIQPQLVADGDSWRIDGDGAEQAVLAYARSDGDRLVYDLQMATA